MPYAASEMTDGDRPMSFGHLTTEAAITMYHGAGEIAVAKGEYDGIGNFFGPGHPACRDITR